jgi:NAD(P)-dependent dehydrogenase (short-subunit alcohol dehydrogenase family)
LAHHQPTGRGAVVITGTSTGIGAATAIRLAELGFSVFAGVRQLADGEALQARTSHHLVPLIIDITDGASITSAARAVTEAVGNGGGLAGLVNNAGIVKPGPIEFQPLADFRMQLEVNLVGQVAVTQAFLPLIRRGHGRIVNVGSIGGRLVLPLHGAYSASKFGMEAISDALRIELRQWSIPVSLVDPGASATAIFGKTLAAIDNVRHTLDERGERAYDEQIDAVRHLVEKTAANAAPAQDVAEAVVSALTARKPKTRYLAGKGAHPVAVAARTLPDRLKDKVVAHEADLPWR